MWQWDLPTQGWCSPLHPYPLENLTWRIFPVLWLLDQSLHLLSWQLPLKNMSVFHFLLNLGCCYWILNVNKWKEKTENAGILTINLKCAKQTTATQKSALNAGVIMELLKTKVASSCLFWQFWLVEVARDVLTIQVLTRLSEATLRWLQICI